MRAALRPAAARRLAGALGLAAVLATAAAGCPAPPAPVPAQASAAPVSQDTVSPDRVSLSPRPAAEVFAGRRIRAVTLDARREVTAGTLEGLKGEGVTTVVVVPFGWMEARDAPAVRMNPDARWYSEGDAGIRALDRAADSLGLALVLKPHLWVRDGTWSGEVAMAREADWQAWEASYQAFADHYARLSAEIGAPFFVVGTELGAAALARPAFFRALAVRARSLSGMPVTYAANWDEAARLRIWDAYDAIGVNAYFPLANSAAPPATDAGATSPTDADLARGWAPHVATLDALARRTGRPVLVTEVGYRSAAAAAARPWEHARRGDAPARPDTALQARLYRAFFARVWAQPWCAGAVIWKVYGSEMPDERVADDYTPEGKPAAAVLRRHYRAADPPRR